MKTWVRTSWIYRTFGHVANTTNSKSRTWTQGCWERTDYIPNYTALTEALNEISAHCNKQQMTVKAILPLTSARTYDFGQSLEYASLMNGVVAAAGLGYGWGFSNVVGIAALLEQIEEISDEEYKRRSQDMESPSIDPSKTPPPLPVSAQGGRNQSWRSGTCGLARRTRGNGQAGESLGRTATAG